MEKYPLLELSPGKGLMYIPKEKLNADFLLFDYYADYEIEELIGLCGLALSVLNKEISVGSLVELLIEDHDSYWSSYISALGNCVMKRSLTKMCFPFPKGPVHTLDNNKAVFLHPSCIPNDGTSIGVITNYMKIYEDYTKEDFHEMYTFFFNIKERLIFNEKIEPFFKNACFKDYLEFVCELLGKVIYACSNQA